MNIIAKKILLFIFLFGLLGPITVSASIIIDSLNQAIKTAPEDTTKVHLLLDLCWQLHRIDIIKMEDLANQSLALSKKIEFKDGIGLSYNYLSLAESSKGNYNKAIERSLASIEIAKETDSESE